MISCPFLRQNTWLKLATFLLVLPGAFFAIPLHLVLQIGLFLLYFAFQPRLFSDLLLAIRRLLPFLAGYWLFGTVFYIQFTDMLVFSARLILLILGTVYFFGSLNPAAILGDTERIRSIAWIQSSFLFLVATLMFIHNYHKLFKEHPIKARSGVSEVLSQFASVMKQNLEQAPEIEARSLAMQQRSITHDTLSGSNLLGLIYLCLSMLVYAL
jgi:hypothetical protein